MASHEELDEDIVLTRDSRQVVRLSRDHYKVDEILDETFLDLVPSPLPPGTPEVQSQAR